MSRPISNSTGKLPVTDIDAGASGDCFYYAVYEALKERGLIKGLAKTIGKKYGRWNSIIPTYYNDAKENFNKYFRALIAEQITNEYLAQSIILLSNDKRLDGLLNKTPGSDSYQSDLHSLSIDYDLSQWFIKIFISTMKKEFNETKFRKKIQDGIMTKGNEVQQIEINIATEILGSIGIQMKIVQKKMPNVLTRASQYRISGLSLDENEKQQLVAFDNEPTYTLNGKFANKRIDQILLPIVTQAGEPIIYIINNPVEAHYSYFSFNAYNGGKRKTRRDKKLKKKKKTRRMH